MGRKRKRAARGLMLQSSYKLKERLYLLRRLAPLKKGLICTEIKGRVPSVKLSTCKRKGLNNFLFLKSNNKSKLMQIEFKEGASFSHMFLAVES